MDLSKAFDCVLHDLLLAKLHVYGFREKMVTFKYSYLKKRIQNVKIRGGSRTSATFKMERFVIIVNGWKPLTIITKRSILDVAAVLDPSLKIDIFISFQTALSGILRARYWDQYCLIYFLMIYLQY